MEGCKKDARNFPHPPLYNQNGPRPSHRRSSRQKNTDFLFLSHGRSAWKGGMEAIDVLKNSKPSDRQALRYGHSGRASV